MVTLRSDDTVLLSSSTIPGNELQLQKMLNDLVIQDVNLITNNDMDVHAS
jgi:mRNA degradation ribonuclease J1/J2